MLTCRGRNPRIRLKNPTARGERSAKTAERRPEMIKESAAAVVQTTNVRGR